MTGARYARSDFAAALVAVGVRPGDVVFTHSNIGFFGRLEGASTAEEAGGIVLAAIEDVIGRAGTFVVPTFTLSFCKGLPFDIRESASNCGIFAEYVRRSPTAFRSTCPLFSVAAVGSEARSLTENVSNECFGTGSIWERMIERDAIICNFNLDAGSTLIHHIEWRLGVPYRRDRDFRGAIIDRDRSSFVTARYFSRNIDDSDAIAAFERFDLVARERRVASSARVGRGALVAIRARDMLLLVAETLAKEPRFLTRAGRVSLSNAL